MQRSDRNLRTASAGMLALPLCLATLHAMARPPQAARAASPHVATSYTVQDVGFRLVTNGSAGDIGEFFPGINEAGQVVSGSDTSVATGGGRLAGRGRRKSTRN